MDAYIKTDLWNKFCGHHENFTAWDNNEFGPCFEQICLTIPAHILLAIVSTYSAARTAQTSVFEAPRLPPKATIRFVSVILLTTVTVLQLLLSVLVFEFHPSVADSLTIGICSLTWLLHAIYIYRLKYMFWETFRGPSYVTFCYLMVFIIMCLHIYNVISLHIHGIRNRNTSDEYCTYVIIGIHFVYLGSLLGNNDRYNENDILRHSLNISPSEAVSLLPGNSSTYGSVRASDHETRVSEDGSSLLYKLTFHWVQPIMVKGFKKNINNAKDLHLLPNKLNSNDIDQKFCNIFNPINSNTQLGTNPDFSSTRSIATVDISSRTLLHTQRNEHSMPNVDFRTTKGSSTKPSLLKALHIAFGVEYYLLGILKLLADGAGFAGPVLLNLLVKYIEEKEENESYGYIYASGLLLSTFLGAVFSSQFDYHCRNVGYKIRCAVITTIFRKSLSVSSVSVTKFNTGEIVNFMSTDTDRMVNFCNSFHALWSLPFQIAVSLYLLYLQVGLAFLTGLGFAIILIPINKWLANKIGELSTAMMKQKDNRVKVRLNK